MNSYLNTCNNNKKRLPPLSERLHAADKRRLRPPRIHRLCARASCGLLLPAKSERKQKQKQKQKKKRNKKTQKNKKQKIKPTVAGTNMEHIISLFKFSKIRRDFSAIIHCEYSSRCSSKYIVLKSFLRVSRARVGFTGCPSRPYVVTLNGATTTVRAYDTNKSRFSVCV